ncbi:MAG: helix-turn-helix domain-containing protein [bacterium]
MELSINWLSILLLVGSGHGFLLGLAFLGLQRGNRVAHRIFAATLLVMAFGTFLQALADTGYLYRYPHFDEVMPTVIFLFAPLFYFYVKAYTDAHFKFEPRHLLHFLPALLCAVYYLPYLLSPAQIKQAHILDHQSYACVRCLVMFWLSMLQIAIYLTFLFRLLKQSREGIRRSMTALDKRGLSWLGILMTSVFVIWMVSALTHLIIPSRETEALTWLLIALDIYLVGYMGLLCPDVFAGIGTRTVSRVPNRKYERSSLTPGKAEAYLHRLKQLMAEAKPYLESEINLQTLAKRLGMPSHHLSQIINDKLHCNFFEFINSHRVEEAKRRIAAPRNHHLNLAEIGLEVGFNSISSFNAAFKKHAGMTPSQFRNEAISDLSQKNTT